MGTLFRTLLCATTASLAASCASAPTPPAAPAPVHAGARVQKVELLGVDPEPALAEALKSFEGRQASAPALDELADLVRSYYAWLEWRDVDVQPAPDADANGVLRVAVSGAAPLEAEAPPEAWIEIPMPRGAVEDAVPAPTAPGGARPERALDLSFAFWLDSPARALIDASERRIFVKSVDGIVSYPVAVGTRRTPTPPGDYWVEAIRHKPTWYPPASIRREHAAKGKPLPAFVPPGRGNPLGSWFLRLQNSIGIHGTNQPRSIGTAASHGCIRMHDRDVAELASTLKSGDRILIVRQRPATVVASQPSSASPAPRAVLGP